MPLYSTIQTIFRARFPLNILIYRTSINKRAIIHFSLFFQLLKIALVNYLSLSWKFSKLLLPVPYSDSKLETSFTKLANLTEKWIPLLKEYMKEGVFSGHESSIKLISKKTRILQVNSIHSKNKMSFKKTTIGNRTRGIRDAFLRASFNIAFL